MNPYRDGIVAPGMRDNDWAHATDDDVWFVASVRGRRAGGASALAEAAGADAARSETAELPPTDRA